MDNGRVDKLTGVGGQVPALDDGLVPVDLDVLADRHGEIRGPATKDTEHVGRKVRETKAVKVGRPRNAHVGLALDARDLGGLDGGHIVLPGLHVLFAPHAVHEIDRELFAKDIGQLDAVPILAAHELLLALVVVGRGQELSKDELRHPDLVLGVLDDVDAFAVILNRQARFVNGDANVLDGVLAVALPHANDLVVGVDDNLVKELVETGIKVRDGLLGKDFILDDVHELGAVLGRANVSVGQLENVLTVRVLLVCCRSRSCHSVCAGFQQGHPSVRFTENQLGTRNASPNQKSICGGGRNRCDGGDGRDPCSASRNFSAQSHQRVCQVRADRRSVDLPRAGGWWRCRLLGDPAGVAGAGPAAL